MEAITELQALRNAAENIPGMEIHEKPQHDKRRTVGRYFAQLGRATVSPVLDYENMNYFLLGWIKGSKKDGQKSEACREVLRIMDASQQPDYGQALRDTLAKYPGTNREALEAELNQYI